MVGNVVDGLLIFAILGFSALGFAAAPFFVAIDLMTADCVPVASLVAGVFFGTIFRAVMLRFFFR